MPSIATAQKNTKTPSPKSGPTEKKEAKPAKVAGPTKRDVFRAQKIKVLVKENPKREGTPSYERFELYKTGQTVTAFLEAGGSTADLRYDVAHKFVELA